jgi:hypothetical protein
MPVCEKRGRGRPKGSGKDDSADLLRIADVRIANPDISDWVAINQVVTERAQSGEFRRLNVKSESVVRRLLAKWQKGREALLQEAGDRKQRDAERERLRADQELAARMVAAAERLQPTVLALEAQFRAAGERMKPWMDEIVAEAARTLAKPEVCSALEMMSRFKLDPVLLGAIDDLSRLAIDPRLANILTSAHRFEIDPKTAEMLRRLGSMSQSIPPSLMPPSGSRH